MTSDDSLTFRVQFGDAVCAPEKMKLAERRFIEGARRLLLAQETMAQVAPKGIFHDAVASMILELFISGEEGQTMHVKQLVIASRESSTAALRRIDRLERENFIVKIPDLYDNRRIIVKLTNECRELLISVLGDIFPM